MPAQKIADHKPNNSWQTGTNKYPGSLAFVTNNYKNFDQILTHTRNTNIPSDNLKHHNGHSMIHHRRWCDLKE